MKKLNVAIICGGPSSEHEVSCVSAGGVLGGLDRERFVPTLIGISKEGQWFLLPNDYPLKIVDKTMPTVSSNGVLIELRDGGFFVNNSNLGIDCVFPVLHGEFGEDGQLQQLLDNAGVPYVGSGVQASAQAMDKAIAKSIFEEAGMQVADGVFVSSGDWRNKSEGLEYPVFVKPASGGSSRGTHKVKAASQLQAAVEDALLFDETVLIEQAIVGREIECAVLERDGGLQASVVGEIVINEKFEFYDFEAKYLDDATTVRIPADIPSASAEEIKTQAIRAFKSLGCSGLARCDFFYTPSGQIIINEINTMPGFTGTSVYPKLWQATDLNYTDLITALIETAVSK